LRHTLIAVCCLLATQIAVSHESSDLAAEARSILGAGQGAYVEAADGTVLLAQAADKAVHPASISKIPTTLALLRKLGADHRFLTTFASSGPVVNGTLTGDLLVECGGDPSLVDENALMIARQLGALGIKRVAGELRVRGSLTFDWKDDDSGVRLRRALSGFIPPEAVAAVRSLQPVRSTESAITLPVARRIEFIHAAGIVAPAVTATALPSAAAMPTRTIAVSGGGTTGASRERALVVNRSQPLLSLLKGLNDYSNNIVKQLADQAGGASAVESVARSVVPAFMRDEIVLGDGAGTDPRNRLSPRVTVILLRTLDTDLAATGHHLFDVLPVAGVDDGTLQDRLDEPSEVGRVVGKTGTFGSYGASALVGAISTSDRGTVYFAILNHGVPVGTARRRQDRFVRVLLARLHTVPWDYQRDPRPAIARTEVVGMQ